jgi:DUF971 family protein
MNIQPIKIDFAGEDQLLIQWSDGMRRQHGLRELSDACPCANCREAEAARAPSPSSLEIVSLEQARPLKLRAMTPVGNYAYRIEFEGGCTAGIYRFEHLRRLGEEVN